jgi:uncharacterized protein (DUF362 family)
MPDSILQPFASPRVGASWHADPSYALARVRAQVEDAMLLAGLPDDCVRPGDVVVIKPNWIKEHDERRPGPGSWEHVVTHPCVVEAVACWAAAQLRGTGAVLLCDAPQTDSSFDRIREYCGLDAMLGRCRHAAPGVRFELLDLRPEEWLAVDGVTVSRRTLPGDPRGSTEVHLDGASEFVGYGGEGRLYGASYDMAETNRHHQGDHHEYLLCRTPMDADVLINVPKLKTHKKVGLTCALKNLVGINANKNWLPHHTEGTPDSGGDQFPSSTPRTRLEHSWMGAAKAFLKDKPALSRWFVPLKKAARLVFGDTQQVVRSGNWHGNDTCWRMVLDLNKCLFHFDGAGRRRAKPLRYLAVVDAIVGGEGNGPMAPDPKACGLILAGTHPVAVDCAAAALMGFDWHKLRLLERSFSLRELDFVPFTPAALELRSNRPDWSGPLDSLKNTPRFRPHFGWTGAIERAV